MSRSSNTPATPVSNPASEQVVEPCPFCGSAGMVIPCMRDWAEAGYQPMGRLIVCAANDCAGAGMPAYGEGMEDRAIELWNRRAAPAPSRDAAVPASGGVEALQKAVVATLTFYDDLENEHAPGEARILDELQAAYRASLSPAPTSGSEAAVGADRWPLKNEALATSPADEAKS